MVCTAKMRYLYVFRVFSLECDHTSTAFFQDLYLATGGLLRAHWIFVFVPCREDTFHIKLTAEPLDPGLIFRLLNIHVSWTMFS